jgi:hypothetical protein
MASEDHSSHVGLFVKSPLNIRLVVDTSTETTGA